MRLVLYTGKGGVGKTTTAAATAVCAARRGRRTLVASADAAHSLGDVFERRLGPAPVTLASGLDAVEIDARVEVRRYWGRIESFLVEFFRHQGIEPVVAEELALLPGAEEVTALLAVEEFAVSGGYDLIVLDCAPTDATLRLVTLPDVAQKSLRVLLPLVRMLAGVTAPIARRLVEVPLPDARVFGDVDELVNRQLRPLAERLTDRQTSVRLVVTPERMVIDESRRAWTELALFDVGCDAIVLNRVLPPEAGREDFFRDWMRVQEDRRREVEALFAPHPVLCAPMRSDEVTGLERLATHGEALFAGVEPEAVLSTAPRVVFRRDGDAYLAVVPLPGADPAQLEVAKVEDELTITTGLRRRSLKLPRRMASLVLEAARLDGTSL
ncbi:MAG: TRC40/GET3/ArsA family transport-energizing ATPase, partial [Myxococcota bacterium]|nr:TRC40/GET3/ArsA family transport-energizing ATPase [Myxococcota bacterium]